jgi:hypothetical protein
MGRDHAALPGLSGRGPEAGAETVRPRAAALPCRRPFLLAFGLAAGLAAAAAVVPAAQQDDATVIVDDFKYPEYDKNGKVEFMLYGRRARKAGTITNLEEVRLEWVEELPAEGGEIGRASCRERVS